jgi:flagellar biosynthesis protein FliR
MSINFILPLTRLFSFFFLSPGFSRFPFPFFAKAAFTLAIALFASTILTPISDSLWVGIPLELAAGYLLGTLFAFIFESILVAANLLGNLGGFTLSNLLTNENQNTLPSPLILTAFVLFFSLDLHHLMIKPLLYTPLSNSLLAAPIQTFPAVLQEGFLLLTTPFILLAGVGLFISILSKLFPTFPLFWTLLPLQLVLGLVSLLYVLSRLGAILMNLMNFLL